MTDLPIISAIVRHVLPVAAIILSAACLVLVMDMDREAAMMRQCIIKLQDRELARSKADVAKVDSLVHEDMWTVARAQRALKEARR